VTHTAQAEQTRGGRTRTAPVPGKLPSHWPAIAALAAFAAGAGSGGLILFALFSALFFLAIPTAVRWLRSASALGMSPAYVALSDRPG
jgi:hypothetical protein